MSLASLYNIPQDDRETLIFSFNNADQHRQIAAEILALSGVNLPQYVIDPIGDPVAWAYNHQQAHNAQNEVLGIAGTDLSSVDFSDKAQLSSWITLHAIEHREASEILGLG